MKFANTEVFNFEGAFRGMRNPKNSWHLSDSYVGYDEWDQNKYIVGKKDLELAQKLILAGSEHSKFMRQIFVSADITAPLYWWKEFDTYKIGTVANSTSTMHKLASTPITLDCFEFDDCDLEIEECFGMTVTCSELGRYIINTIEEVRQKYLETNDKKYWRTLIQLLPESWLQTRTITMNYSNIRNMYYQRINHKLTEWSSSFTEWIESLPYSKELIMLEVK